jgi:uracil-DNA glycosylase
MSSDTIDNELSSIAEAAREHVAYLQELGIDSFEGAATQLKVPAKSAQQTIPSPPVSKRPEPPIVPIPKPSPPVRAAVSKSAADSLFGEIFTAPEPGLPESNETFDQIWADVGNCTRCSLCQGRTNIVHTEGKRNARLMFIGEAPGADEDAQARPFVGRAGQLLTRIIEAIGMKREEVLIGNINRCRPPGNRAPMPDEVAMCKPFLLREIASARPEVIVVLGNTAMKNLLDTREGITRLRGIFQDYKGIKVMPTFHPAYLLRDPSKKRETWEDLKKVRDYLDNTAPGS